MKISPLTTTVCIALAASITAATAGEVPFGVHADATWFAHADLPALKATTVGQKVSTLLREGKAGAKMAALSTVFNFDPRSDLEDLTLYGFGKEHDGALIVRGTFDPGRMLTLVQAGDDYQSETYEGHALHSWTEVKHGHSKRTHSVLQADDILVFADDLAVLKKAVDVLDGRAASLRGADQFPGLANSPRGGFIFAAANMADMALSPKAQTLKMVTSAVMTIGEAEGLVYADMAVETSDAQAAENMKMILDGMAAMALMNQERNPAGARMAEKSEVVVEGSRLIITLWSPAADVIAHMEKKAVR